LFSPGHLWRCSLSDNLPYARWSDTEWIHTKVDTYKSYSLLRRGFCWLWLRLALRYISLHFTLQILEHERSHWAKERSCPWFWRTRCNGVDMLLASVLMRSIHPPENI
jgi:hypothetical protein